MFRRIGREIEDLDLVLVLRQPLLHLLRMVDAQIVDDKEDLLFRVPDKTLHEIEENRHLQGAVIGLNRIRPRLFTAAIMLVENFCPVWVRIGVWPFGA